MGLSIGVLKETLPGERRVAITPKVIDVLTKAGAEVLIEAGAGLDSGFPDEDYTAKGAKIAPAAAGSRRRNGLVGSLAARANREGAPE